MTDVANLTVTLDGDVAGLLASLDAVLASAQAVDKALSDLSKRVVTPVIKVDTLGAVKNIAKVNTLLNALAHTEVQPRVIPNISNVAPKIAAATAQLDALGKLVVHPVIDPVLGGVGGVGATGAPGAAGAAGAGGDAGGIAGGILGGGAGGAAGGLAGGVAAAGGAALFFHTAHLFLPEVLGLATALFSVGAGFTALGLAAASSVGQIAQGYHAVSAAQDAIAAAIPGTTQWSAGVGQLGQAWSAIPAVLQPAVSAINTIMSRGGAMTNEIQRWLGAQAEWFAKAFSGGGSVFAPLILATERAINVIEGMFSHSLGSGGLTRFVSSMARMVGPALVELVQLGAAIFHIASGFARAIIDGQGLEALVNIFRGLAAVVNSSAFQGFVAGWVDFDRIISVLLGLLGRLIGFISSLGSNVGNVTVLLGFLASAFLTLKSGAYVLQALGVNSGAFSAGLSGMIGKAAGIGLLAVGISGLVSTASNLLGVSDPLKSAWNAVASALGLASKGAGSAISTTSGYTAALSGAIPVTANFTAAQDLLIRSEQSVGSSLGGMANGLQKWSLTAVGASGQAKNTAAAFTSVQTAVKAATDSISSLLGTLQAKNVDLATWAADAAILFRRGLDPALIASFSQQAPQDLATMVTASIGKIKSFNVQFAEQMMLAKMSGQNGMMGLIQAIEGGLASGSPVLVAAAKALATLLGNAFHKPFTGTVASVQAIGTALQGMPTKYVQTIAGVLGKYSVAANDAATATKKLAAPTANWSQELLTVGAELGEVMLGLKLGIPLIGSLATQMMLLPTRIGLAGLAMKGFALSVWGGVTATLAWLAELPAMIGGFAAVAAGWTADAVSSTAAFIAENAATLGLAAVILALVTALLYMVTHWRQTWNFIRTSSDATRKFLDSVWHGIYTDTMAVWNPLMAFFRKWWPLLLTIVTLGTDLLVAEIVRHWHDVTAVTTTIWHAIQMVVVTAWHSIYAIVTPIVSALSAWVRMQWTVLVDTAGVLWRTLLAIAHEVWAQIQAAVVGPVELMVGLLSHLFGVAKSTVVTDLAEALGAALSIAGKFFSVGQAIVMGIVHGVESLASAIGNAVSNAANGALAAVKGILGIKSPSTVFAEQVGVPIAQGIAQGILSSRSLISGALFGVTSPMGLNASLTGGRSTGSVSFTHNISVAAGAHAQDIAGAVQDALTSHDTHLLATLRSYQGAMA